MATFDATDANSAVSMLVADEVDHAVPGVLILTTAYDWTTTANFRIQVFSVLEDITLNGGAPASGTVSALWVNDAGGSLHYHVAGMAGNLVAMTTAPNLEAY